ncbi:MAG: tetratricopeptide repeat protein [bacterium]|nr:tetratricopeptide repeat protein [bacterium]
MATALAQGAKSADALVLFEHALSEGHKGYELYTNLAAVLTDEGLLARAEEYYRKSIELSPGKVEAVANLSTLLIQQGRAAEARDLLAEVLPYFPDDAYLLNVVGMAEFRLDNLVEAERHIRKAVVAEPATAEYRYNLAAVLASMGRRYGAIEEFENTAVLGRVGADLHNNLGALYMEAGQTEEGRQEFRRAIAANPEDYGAHINLAMYELTAGEPDTGMILLKQAQKLDPQQPAAFLVEAEILIQTGKKAEARSILERLLRDSPDLAPARQLLEQTQ